MSTVIDDAEEQRRRGYLEAVLREQLASGHLKPSDVPRYTWLVMEDKKGLLVVAIPKSGRPAK